MSRRVLARSITLLVALALGASFAPSSPAFAATTTKVEVEGSNWFWESQDRMKPSDITGGCPPSIPLPTCPDPVIGLPNPHEPGALPIMVLNGEVEKVAAVEFDTEFLPFQGATIDRFVFSVVETPDPRDIIQTFNQDGKKFKACLITDIWPVSEDGAEEMEFVPPFDCGEGVEGVRKEGATATDPAFWEFDATKLVQRWGDDPFSAYGIMFVPVVAGSGPLETWQLVLKGPRRDVADTPIDEAEPNANNIKAQISYTANPEIDDGGTDGGGFDGGSDGGGFDFGGGTDPDPEPTTDPVPEPTDPGTEGSGDPVAAPVSDSSTPGTAWYLWLLIPAAIFGIAMARAAVIEPAGGRRPDGVVAMIRSQNAARRGITLVDDTPQPGLFAAPFVALFAAIRDDLSNARSKLKRK